MVLESFKPTTTLAVHWDGKLMSDLTRCIDCQFLFQQWDRRSCWHSEDSCRNWPCYGPCCTWCLSRMGTGECGPRHVFQHDQFYYWPAITRVILEQLIGRPLLHLGCRHHVLELVLAGGCCFWSAHGTSSIYIPCMGPSKEPEIPQFKRFHRQWALIGRRITTVLLLVITFHHSYHWLIDWLIDWAWFNVSTNTV